MSVGTTGAACNLKLNVYFVKQGQRSPHNHLNELGAQSTRNFIIAKRRNTAKNAVFLLCQTRLVASGGTFCGFNISQAGLCSRPPQRGDISGVWGESATSKRVQIGAVRRQAALLKICTIAFPTLFELHFHHSLLAE